MAPGDRLLSVEQTMAAMGLDAGQRERLRPLVTQRARTGEINPALPPIAVLYTLYARACDPVVGFLRGTGQFSDDEIVGLVLRTCFDGVGLRA